MNRKQRFKNRETAKKLQYEAHTCSNCGLRGLHWIQAPTTLLDMLDGRTPQGFWTCPKYYGADGKRII